MKYHILHASSDLMRHEVRKYGQEYGSCHQYNSGIVLMCYETILVSLYLTYYCFSSIFLFTRIRLIFQVSFCFLVFGCYLVTQKCHVTFLIKNSFNRFPVIYIISISLAFVIDPVSLLIQRTPIWKNSVRHPPFLK